MPKTFPPLLLISDWKRTLLVVLLMMSATLILPQHAFAACADPAGPGVVWTGCDKSLQNLTGVDLTGALVNGANLNSANLTSANLSGANLSGTTFNGTTLINANLSGANITGANLTNADLTGATGTPGNHHLATFNNTTCPLGSNSATNGTNPPKQDCWTSTAVTLAGFRAEAGSAPLFLLPLGIVLAGGLAFIARKRGLS